MRALLLLLLLAACAGARADDVLIAVPDAQLRATYALPPGPVTGPAIVGLHGCGGPFPDRDGQWRDLFVKAGNPVLLPDSFGSRGFGSLCSTRERIASPGGKRRTDTVAAVEWLLRQPTTQLGGVVVLGWSNGGSTVLAAAEKGVIPQGSVRGFVAFYPGCRFYAEKTGWAPSAPLLIVMGDADDWTPPEPCRVLAARFPDQIKLILYPGAYHDFDTPNRPIRVRTGLAFTANGDGVAHVGTNVPGREAVMRDVPAWVAGLAVVK